MTWLQENWIIATVGLVVAIALLWWLLRRKGPEELARPTTEPAKPAKPLEANKPDIIPAEPARFKPRESAPHPVASTPPADTPVAKAAPVSPAAAPVAKADPAPRPAPKPRAKAAPKPSGDAMAAPKKAADAPKKATPKSTPAPAAPAKTDNLQLLKGVGPKMVTLLSGLGVTRFQQIADWTAADIAVIDPQLGAFQGRIARDNLVDQAGYLAKGDQAGFEAKYGALGGEL